ncbi:hypothetical protein J7L87_06625, partial [bacterium]|nr:hypothetical protein [bacterium]
KKNEYWEGYSENYIPFLIESKENLKNEIVNVKAEEIKENKIFSSEAEPCLSKKEIRLNSGQ